MVARLIRERRVSELRLAGVMLRVRRHRFVPPELELACYEPYAHELIDGQTLTCPDFVAQMVSLLELRPGDCVLEVGSGTGYQSAVLNAMGATVTTIEILPSLHQSARENLARRHIRVDARLGDGALGAPDRAPFDAILVACAAFEVPPALLEQLAIGGRLVAPVGDPSRLQTLTRIRRTCSGLTQERIRAAWFVPMTGVVEDAGIR